MGKARNKNRTLSKADKVYAKKERNKKKKQNQRRTGTKDILKKVAATNKNRIAGLLPTESRRSYRKRLAKFRASKETEKNTEKRAKLEDNKVSERTENANPLGPRNASYESLVNEYEALNRRIKAGVSTSLKQFNSMLNKCAAIGEYHLAVYLLGEISAQDLEPDFTTIDTLRLLLQKTPTMKTYIKGVELDVEVLGGLHPKAIVKQLIQKHVWEAKWEGMQSQVATVKEWLKKNINECNDSGQLLETK